MWPEPTRHTGRAATKLTSPGERPTLAGMTAEPAPARAEATGDTAGFDSLRPPGAELPGEATAEADPRPLYPAFDLGRTREEMKAIVRERGLTLQEVGFALGAADEKSAVNAAFYLLNHARGPSLADAVAFCNLTGVPIDRLVGFSEKPPPELVARTDQK